MNDPAFKTAAFNLAENTPECLGQPTTPPISWRQEDDILIVILADGRKVRGPIFDRYRDKIASVKKQAIVPGSSVVVPVPARGTGAEAPTASLPAKVVVPVPKRDPPAKKKAGKGK